MIIHGSFTQLKDAERCKRLVGRGAFIRVTHHPTPAPRYLVLQTHYWARRNQEAGRATQ